MNVCVFLYSLLAVQVLEELDAEKRLNKALVLIKKELELGKIQQEIQQQV